MPQSGQPDADLDMDLGAPGRAIKLMWLPHEGRDATDDQLPIGRLVHRCS